uniref:Interleukin-12 receptor subunit beta-1 isoform X4 n=1 Tax=Geotrypetes seraphini TaxID=260995 RepID=A0A6P8RYZ3_GEOSA|nr:interleukin-12 receptor subunit beta-1 isoform X4 [Geotrypetes seraphini]
MLPVMFLLLAANALRGCAQKSPTDLICYLKYDFTCMVCTWRAGDSSADTTYRLHLCNEEKSYCEIIDTGTSTQLIIDRQEIHIDKNYTAWVQSCLQGHCHSSSNITLIPFYSIKYNPPSSEAVEFSRFNGTLRMTWKNPENQPLRKEARYKSRIHFKWTTGDCNLQEDAGDSEMCTLSLADNTAYEIQLRHKSHDSRSHWSEWCDTISVPAKLQESPELHYSVGEISKDGQRNLSFHWEKAAADQGNVNYILRVRMLSCLCEGDQKPLDIPENKTSGSVLISGAVYNFSIEAVNKDGRAPVQSYMIDSDLHTGTVESAKCYRIAAYSRQNKSWSSLGSAYYLKPSKDRGHSNISMLNITAHSATVMWDGSLHNACSSLLLTCYIVKHAAENATSEGQMANTSMTYYTLKNLLSGTKYVVEVIGQTKYGEMLSIGQRHFMTQETDEISPDWIPLAISLILVVFATGGVCSCRKRIKSRLCPVVPDPYDSNATKFPTVEPDLVATPKALLTSTVSSEETEAVEALMVSFSPEKESPVVNRELSRDYNISVEKAEAEVLMDRQATTTTEAEIEIDADLPFEYRRQMLLTSIVGEREDEKDLGEMFGDSDQNESDKKDTELFINTDFSMVPSSLFTLQLKVNLFSPNE